MLCQKCNKNEATTHIRTIVNAQIKEYNLCPHCAKKEGYTSLMSNSMLDFNSFFGDFFNMSLPQKIENTTCDFCGNSFSDIAQSGKVGCAECYTVFYEQLKPSINKMHGESKHAGKIPTGIDKEIKIFSDIESLKTQLKQAIEEQEFEKAAILRDEIKKLEGGV